MIEAANIGPASIIQTRQIVRWLPSVWWKWRSNWAVKIAVELEPLRHYILAEDYHQDYPQEESWGYCHIDVTDAAQPLIDPAAYQKPDQEILKAKLTAEQYQVTQESATERPFHNAYDRTLKRGSMWILRRGASLPRISLHLAVGWPSFSSPIAKDVVHHYQDHSYGMERIEVRSLLQAMPTSAMSSPMDQKTKVASRHCINLGPAALFIPKREMEQEGYGYLLKALRY